MAQRCSCGACGQSAKGTPCAKVVTVLAGIFSPRPYLLRDPTRTRTVFRDICCLLLAHGFGSGGVKLKSVGVVNHALFFFSFLHYYSSLSWRMLASVTCPIFRCNGVGQVLVTRVPHGSVHSPRQREEELASLLS